MKKKKRFLMAVGSSGGHIYPALAVSESLEEILQKERGAQKRKQQTEEELEIHFVHSGSLTGRAILSSSPFPVHEIPIGGLASGQRTVQKIRTILQLPLAFVRAFYLILRLKPCLVFGTGGAVCAPVVLSAFLLLKKIALWEGNAIAGLSNRWLSRFADCVFVLFAGLEGIKPSKQILCAYPLRKLHSGRLPSPPFPASSSAPDSSSVSSSISASDLSSKSSLSLVQRLRQKILGKTVAFSSRGSKLFFPVFRKSRAERAQPAPLNRGSKRFLPLRALGAKDFSVLILGGSQGSLLLNQVVAEALADESWREGLVFFHQTGQKGFSLLKEEYRVLKGLEVFSFSPNLREYYERADLVFSRAGAGAIWETAFYGKPLVLVPLSFSAGGHQLKNAQRLLVNGCVELIEEKDFNPLSFKKHLLELKEDTQKRVALASNLKKAFERRAKESTIGGQKQKYDAGSYQIAQKLRSL